MVVVDISVGVVGDDEVVFGMQCAIAWHILLKVVTTLAEDTDGRRRNVPICVDVSEPLS